MMFYSIELTLILLDLLGMLEGIISLIKRWNHQKVAFLLFHHQNPALRNLKSLQK